MSSFSRQQLEKWLSNIDVSGKVLDIGGGVQNLENRVKSFNPKIYRIMDNGSEKGLHNSWNEPYYKNDICEDCLAEEKDYFDQIFMIEVSEYLKNPNMALDNIFYMLKKNGEFYSSWHFIQPIHPPKGKDYFRYTPDCVEMLLQDSGFKIIEHKLRKTEKFDLREVWSAEKMRGWKDFDNTIIGSLVKAKKE